MSVNYNVTVRTNRLQQVVNAIDGGGGSGVLRLLDGGGNILSSFQLATPSATVAGGVATFNGLSLIDPSAAASGATTAARIEDFVGSQIITGLTVGTSSASDIVMSPTNVIAAGQVVAIAAATITGN